VASGLECAPDRRQREHVGVCQAAALVAPGSGITIVPGSEIYIGGSTAWGLFMGGTDLLPFDAGWF
jgi:hypothetical protein